MAGAVDLTDLDMRARAVPYGEFGRLRREAPVAWSPGEGGFWLPEGTAAGADGRSAAVVRGVEPAPAADRPFLDETAGIGAFCRRLAEQAAALGEARPGRPETGR